MRHFILLFLFACCGNLLAESFISGGITYTITSGNTVKVSSPSASSAGNGGVVIGITEGYEGTLEIPSSVTYNGSTYTVTAADAGVFRSNAQLTSISIPSTLTSLGDRPFTSCRLLTSITVDPSNNAYSSIDGILYDKQATQVIACPSALSVDYSGPSTLTRVAEGAFYGCGHIMTVSLPPSVIEIGAEAFRGCKTLKQINIPSGVKSLEDGVFQSCASLSSIILPSGITRIGDKAFYYCNALGDLAFPSSVETIGAYAFCGCTSMTTATLPSGLTTIGERAFESCSKLTSVSLPPSVKSIGMAVFRNCIQLPSIAVATSNPYFASVDGVLMDKSLTTVYCYPSAKPGETYAVPSTVTAISDYAFFFARNLHQLVLPQNLKSIGISALSNCTALETLVLPHSLEQIGMNAFTSCISLASVSSYSSLPPSLLHQAFSVSAYQLPLYVPRNAVSTYKDEEYWQDFKTILPLPELIYTENTDAYTGALGGVTITIDNLPGGVSAYQFQLILPEGMELLTKTDGSYCYEFSSRQPSSSSLTITPLSDVAGAMSYLLTCTMNASDHLSGCEGVVLTMKMKVDKDLGLGLKTGTIGSSRLTYSNGQVTDCGDSDLLVTVRSGILGDVNSDGRVTVTDVMHVVNDILGSKDDTFVWQLGDLNFDGVISVVDAMLIVDIILNE